MLTSFQRMPWCRHSDDAQDVQVDTASPCGECGGVRPKAHSWWADPGQGGIRTRPPVTGELLCVRCVSVGTSWRLASLRRRCVAYESFWRWLPTDGSSVHCVCHSATSREKAGLEPAECVRPNGENTPAIAFHSIDVVLPVGLEPTPPAGVGRGKIRFPTEFHRRELPPPRPCGAFRCFCKPCGLAQAQHFSCALPYTLSYESKRPSVQVRAAYVMLCH
jgi:hypothetical protein